MNWSSASLAIVSGLLVSTATFGHAGAAVPTWIIDPARSRLGFSGTQTGAHFEGRFTRFSATVAFDPDHPEASLVSVDVDLSSAKSGDTQRDSALPSKEWFDVAHYPRARFVTSSIRKTGPGTYAAAGSLMLHGVTQPVTLPFAFQTNGRVAHVMGQTTLRRSVFSIGQGAFATGQWVGLNVGVVIDLVAARPNS